MLGEYESGTALVCIVLQLTVEHRRKSEQSKPNPKK